jgi:hypothetical protein
LGAEDDEMVSLFLKDRLTAKITCGILGLALLAALVVGYLSGNVVNAQGPNLLQNPGFDQGVYPKAGVDGYIPNGWDLWANGQPPATDLKGDPWGTQVHSQPYSWIMRGGFINWTGGGLQTATVEQGKTYRFTIYSFQWTCDDDEYSCIPANGPRFSDKSSGAKVRIGIDPFGGRDANGANVLWGPFVQPWDSWQALSLDATAMSTQMTVFTYATSSAPLFFREHLWDDASLTTIEGGAPVNAPAATATPEIRTVPFVVAQVARPDGSVVHVVGAGDTFSSIIVAYRPLGVTRDSVLELNGWDLPPAIILIGDEIKILPPGSVNPQTGELLSVPVGTPRSTGPSTLAPTSTPNPNATPGTVITPVAPSGGPSQPGLPPDVEKGG